MLASLIEKLSALQYTVYIQKKKQIANNIGSLRFQWGFLGVVYTAYFFRI